MNIMELGAIGELVGGVAVIASLIYVAIQIRQNSEQTRQANLIERARANREVVHDFNEIFLTMRDPAAVEIYSRGMVDFDGLSTQEQGTLHMYLGPLVLHAISAFLAARDELMDDDFGDAWVNNWVAMARCPGIRVWWNHAKLYFPKDFVTEVDRLLTSTEGPPPYHEGFPWFDRSSALEAS